MKRTFELCVASRMENLTAVSDFITATARELGLDEGQTFALQVAVDEACANVIEHAYGGRTDGTVRVTCQLASQEVIVRVYDHGRSFDPESVPPPDPTAPLDEQEDRALGLYLMGKLMDSVEFDFDAVQGNVLTMRKRRHNGSPSLNP